LTLALAVLASLLSIAAPVASDAASATPRLAAGDRIPIAVPIRIADLSGGAVDLGQEIMAAPGGVRRATLLVFWATWCQPCIDEIPDLNELHRYFAKDGFRVIGIGVGGGDDTAALAAAVSRFGITYPVWFDKDGAAARAFGVRALPASALVDGKGVVLWTGPTLPPDVNAMIKKAVKPAEDGE